MAGMYGPNDVLGAMGYERDGCFGGCFGVVVALIVVGASLFFVF